MKVTDRVCGLRLDLEKAMAQEDYEEWAYFFCSMDCHRRFGASPGDFSPAAEPAPLDEGQREGRNSRRITCEKA